MQQHYNKNIHYMGYVIGLKVLLKVKHYNTGENKKLAPRVTWTIVEKLPNGVTFRIENWFIKPNSHLMRHHAARRVTVRQKHM